MMSPNSRDVGGICRCASNFIPNKPENTTRRVHQLQPACHPAVAVFLLMLRTLSR